MSWLGILLIGFAVTDLTHAVRRVRFLPECVGALVAMSVGLLAGLTSGRDVLALFVVAEGATGGPDAGLVNAGLVLRDERVSGLSERSVSVLRGLLSEETQREVAEALGISASAVSQRVRADGLAAIVAAHDLVGPTKGDADR